jgi:mRNA interferase MazF
MNEGDVVLAPLAQADGKLKNRPAIVLCRMPPFGDLLVCGVSTQLQHAVSGFDEVIEILDADFAASGLKSASLIRLGFLSVLPTNNFVGRIGSISAGRHRGLLTRLSDFLRPGAASQRQSP